MIRPLVLAGTLTLLTAFGPATHAQPRGQSREDLLDALTRHIQICSEISDSQARRSTVRG